MNPFYPVLLLLIFLYSACSTPPEQPALATYFQELSALPDTLFISPETPADSLGKPIPFEVLKKEVDLVLLEEGPGGIPDSAYSLWIGHWLIPLDDTFDAYLMEEQVNWFNFRYLLLYSREARQFVDAVLVGQFYGGESGQIWIEGRLFDLDQAGGPHLLLRNTQHATVLQEEAFQEYWDEYVELLQWENGRFSNIPVRDSSRWIEAYPSGLRKNWE